MGTAFLSANGWASPERQEAVHRALELIHQAGVQPGSEEFFAILYMQADWLVSRGHLAHAVSLAEQMLGLSDGNTGLPLALAHWSLGFGRFFQGRFLESRAHLENALEAYAACDRPDTIPLVGGDLDAICHSILAADLAFLGYVDQAHTHSAMSIQRARQLKNPVSLGTALITSAVVSDLRGDGPGLYAIASDLQQLGQAEKLPFFLAYGQAMQGLMLLSQAPAGSPAAAAGYELVQQGFRVWQATGTKSGGGQWLANLATACLRTGRIEEGLRMIASGLEGSLQIGIEGYLPEIHRLKGELLLKLAEPRHVEAEACFSLALDLARRGSAHSLELRAAISQARLWQPARPAEGRRLLAETLAWFGEGLDTSDWREAREMLRSIE